MKKAAAFSICFFSSFNIFSEVVYEVSKKLKFKEYQAYPTSKEYTFSEKIRCEKILKSKHKLLKNMPSDEVSEKD